MGKKPRSIVKPLVATSETTPKDNSARVHQRDKISFEFGIRELPWTNKQKDLIRLLLDKHTKCVFVEGPAGSSKTCTAVYAALHLLVKKRVSDIVFIRSAVESADSKIGFLPGTVEEKFEAYMAPLTEKMEEFLTLPVIKKLQTDARVIAMPVNYVRGMHWAAKVIIVDECQNLTYKELVTIITRLGEFSKIIFLGDPYQSDLPYNKSGGFVKMGKLFNDFESEEKGVHHFKFGKEDVVRSEFVKFVVGKLEVQQEEEQRIRFEKEKASSAFISTSDDSLITSAEWSPTTK